MADGKLPHPVTPAEEYLCDIAHSLRQLVAQSAPAAASGDIVALREPAAPAALPADFPGRAALLEAGIDTVTAVPSDGATLTQIKGIGAVTANQILTYLRTR